MIMIVRTPESQKGSPAAAKEEAEGRGRGEGPGRGREKVRASEVDGAKSEMAGQWDH